MVSASPLVCPDTRTGASFVTQSSLLHQINISINNYYSPPHYSLLDDVDQ